MQKLYRIEGYGDGKSFQEKIVVIAIDLTVKGIGILETSVLLLIFIALITFFSREISKNN